MYLILVNKPTTVLRRAYLYNPPKVVAAAYKTVVNEFRGYFDTFEFTVYCRPDDSWNYEVFKRVLD